MSENWRRPHPLKTLDTYPDVPEGAKKIGCRNCTTGDRLQHPELGLVYCATCPVTRRREALKKRLQHNG